MLVGSETVCHIARAFQVPETRLTPAKTGEPICVGQMIKVTPVEGLHAKILGEHIYNEGVLATPPIPPLDEGEYKLGRQFNYLLEIDGFKIYHHGDADLIEANVIKYVGEVDVLILGLALRKGTPNYLERILAITKPKVVIPTHHDNFFLPLQCGVSVMTHTGFEDFVRTARRIKPDVRIITLDFFQEYRLTVPRNATGESGCESKES